ncbi:MAG: branched-chain amino acid ABC transporter permease [Candidatus Methylomirabilales bacterium]
MTDTTRHVLPYALIGLGGVLAPFIAPAYLVQLGLLWMMVLFALTWDLGGGQMGYNSFGNVLFFGIGCYVPALVQRGLYFKVEEYTNVRPEDITFSLTSSQYLAGLALGLALAVVIAVAVGAILGSGILALRGHYFAIATLGVGIAAGELANGWDYVGSGSGMLAPIYPGPPGASEVFFYYLFFALAVTCFFTLKWLYAGHFGLAINAIRDDEDKAEAMGIHTTRYKTVAWCVAAFFLALAGGAFGHLNNFIDRDVAFPAATFGVWMVLMAILGGKGTIWGPVIGAAVFHVTQELTWTYLFGWQRVALGALIVVIVVFFPLGIMGWLREQWPEKFGEKVDLEARTAPVSLRESR